GVNFSFSFGPFGHVWLLVIAFTRNPMVFDTRIDADTIGVNVGPDIIEFEVVSNIAIELAVIVVAGITISRAPYLAGRVRVPPERRNSGRTINRRVDAISRTFVRACDSVRFQDSEPDSFLVEKSIQPREVPALRQPETPGFL